MPEEITQAHLFRTPETATRVEMSKMVMPVEPRLLQIADQDNRDKKTLIQEGQQQIQDIVQAQAKMASE